MLKENLAYPNRCSVPIDKAITLGPHQFSPQATVGHHGHYFSAHYTTSVSCYERTVYCNNSKITTDVEVDINDSSPAYVVK